MHPVQNLSIALAYGVLSCGVLWAGWYWQVKDPAVWITGFLLPFSFIGSCGIGHLLSAAGRSEWAGLWHWNTSLVSWLQVAAIVYYRKDLAARYSATRETGAILAYVNSDPWVVWESATDPDTGEPDLLCVRQNKAAAEYTGHLTGQYLGRVMPEHRVKQQHSTAPLLDTYLDVANGRRDSYEAEMYYQGLLPNGKMLTDWFRHRVVQIGARRVFVTWQNITDERDGAIDQRKLLDVQQALLTRQIIMHYQPIYRLSDMSLMGFEALVRWPQPDGSMRSPAEFLPLIDRAGLAAELFFYTVECALDALAQLPEHLKVAVNLAPGVLMAESFPSRLTRMCDQRRVNRCRLMLELTEEQAVQVPLIPKLKEARGNGHEIAIDDFGTGYANTATLIGGPFDALKIDRSLGSRVDLEPQRAEVLTSVLALAHVLGLVVVAEGLETPGEIAWFRESGCDFGQGFGLGKPAALESLGGLVG